jgi:dynein heavy chain, axonemal
LETLREEISSCLEIYDTLEEFNYKFSVEDLNKRWLIFGGPKDTFELIEQRKTMLEDYIQKFSDEMKTKQEEFKENLESLERTIQNFGQYQNIHQHVEVAKEVESINESLKVFTEEAKKYNSRESLFNKETTDYSIISQISKEFLPYSNLWLTTTNWFKNIVSWQQDDWEKLDAPGAEKFVEDGLRTLGGVIRYIKKIQKKKNNDPI